jgi:hypothetical protein
MGMPDETELVALLDFPVESEEMAYYILLREVKWVVSG